MVADRTDVTPRDGARTPARRTQFAGLYGSTARVRSAFAALATVLAFSLVGAACSSPTPSYPITPEAGDEAGSGIAEGDAEPGGGGGSGFPTMPPPHGGDAYATARNIPWDTPDPDAPYPPPRTEVPPQDAYPEPAED